MVASGESLAGKTAVVTGGGRGIGRAIAEVFADAGAKVVVTARSRNEIDSVAAGIVARGGEAISIPCDVTSERSVSALAAAVGDWTPGVDILVNNAGTHIAIGPIWEVEPKDWWTDVETSLLGPFLCSRAFLLGMLTARTGRIINISSGAATEPRPWSSAYTAAKTGAQRFTESLHRSLDGTGVLAFSLNPGPVMTELNRRNQESAAGKKWYPEQKDMTFFPATKAAGYALTLATGRADGLAGRFLSVFDDLDALIVKSESIATSDLLRLGVLRG